MPSPQRPGAWRDPLALLLFLLAVAAPAQAYIDPGTMSLVWQAVAGAFFGMLFAIKMFWRRIRAFFARLFTGKGKGKGGEGGEGEKPTEGSAGPGAQAPASSEVPKAPPGA